MITETGRIVAVEPDCVWVETIQKSTCGNCTAKKGCGHGLLDDIGAGRRNHLRVLLGGQSSEHFSVNDKVDISIPERMLVQGALVVYMVPLLGLLSGAVLVSQWWQSDVAAFLGGVAGFIIGLALVKIHAAVSRDNVQLQPVVSRQTRADDSSRVIAVDLHNN